jgi:hypothetical protein
MMHGQKNIELVEICLSLRIFIQDLIPFSTSSEFSSPNGNIKSTADGMQWRYNNVFLLKFISQQLLVQEQIINISK